MIIQNQYENYVVNCLENSDVFQTLVQFFNAENLDEDTAWILFQTDFDECLRTVLVNDRRIIIYGASSMVLNNERFAPGKVKFNNAPARVLEYTDERFMYTPIYPLLDQNGNTLVNVQRAVSLFAEKIMETLIAAHPELQLGTINNCPFNREAYFGFEYKVPMRNWRTWWT